MSVIGAEWRVIQPEVRYGALVIPPEPELTIYEGIAISWTGDGVAVKMRHAIGSSTTTDGFVLVDADALLEVMSSGAGRQIQYFAESWYAWSNHPGRYGAVPHTIVGVSEAPKRVENIAWLGANSGPTSRKLEFGHPVIKFERSEWRVFISGFTDPVQQISWRDEESVEKAVSLLDDWDYWKGVASLLHPERWRRAIASERYRLRQVEITEERKQEDVNAAITLCKEEYAVSTRKVARLLRSFDWADQTGSIPLRSVTMEHCDMYSPDTSDVRVAEYLDIQWNSNTQVAPRRQVRDRLNLFLAPHGYSALLMKSGKFFISRNSELLSRHLPAATRARRGTPFVNIR